MKQPKIKLLMGLCLWLSAPSFSHALPSPEVGGHSGNGGVRKEQKLKKLMLDLVPYLYSSEGLKAFPELAKYDLIHPTETIADIIAKTDPVLIAGKPFDIFNAERDCVSHFKNSHHRYFQCNQNAFPKITFKNQPEISSFLFHEILVQARLETPNGPEVPSSYRISARLEFHQETVTSVKWVPGAAVKSPAIARTIHLISKNPDDQKMLVLQLNSEDQINYYVCLKLNPKRCRQLLGNKSYDHATVSTLLGELKSKISAMSGSEEASIAFSSLLGLGVGSAAGTSKAATSLIGEGPGLVVGIAAGIALAAGSTYTYYWHDRQLNWLRTFDALSLSRKSKSVVEYDGDIEALANSMMNVLYKIDHDFS